MLADTFLHIRKRHEMGTLHQVAAAAVVVVIMSSTLLSTTNASGTRLFYFNFGHRQYLSCQKPLTRANDHVAGDEHCDILREKCNARNCNNLQCKHWYGEHHFESVFCKKTPPFPDQCCCVFKENTPPPPGHHPSPSSHHPSPVTPI